MPTLLLCVTLQADGDRGSVTAAEEASLVDPPMPWRDRAPEAPCGVSALRAAVQVFPAMPSSVPRVFPAVPSSVPWVGRGKPLIRSLLDTVHLNVYSKVNEAPRPG
jgi:hypothetical protein